ncbi:MAG: respiratory nitrate reductase subunit gamma [Methanosarcinales archaeon]|jgi:heterodisulfide reductase subunit E|nr:respiratory nitrate reductase subunit gamma [Methanosarcinales archaeon]
MEYFSGIAGVSITFAVMMTMAVLAVTLFFVGLYFNFRKWGQGSLAWGIEPEEGKHGIIGSLIVFAKAYWKQLRAYSVHHGQNILVTIVFDVIFLRRTARADPLRWFMHMCIIIGWMGLFTLSGLMFAVEIPYLLSIYGFKFSLSSTLIPIALNIDFIKPEVFREHVQLPAQLLGYLLLLGILIAIGRRLFIPKVRENTNSYDAIILITLLVIVVTGFIAHAGRYIAIGITDFTGYDFIFYDYLFWTLGGQAPFLTYVREIALTHSVLSLFLGIAFIPYSKYIHVITTPLSMIVNKGGEH